MENGTVKRLEETKRHGSVLFPLNIYPCTIPQDFPSVALHWHRSMELICVKKGEGFVQMGLELLPADAGDIFVLPPGALHAIRAAGDARMEYENIIFDMEFLGAGAADVCAREYLVPLAAGKLLRPMHLHARCADYAGVLSCVQQAERLCGSREPGYELGVKAAMTQMLYLLVRGQKQPSAVESQDTARIKRVLAFVQERFGSHISVRDAAEACGYSSSHFMRWFSRVTGQSFVEYLTEYRLAFAARRLRATDDMVLVIAQEAGYDSLSNFNRQFRRRYGATPTQFRRGEC